MSNQKIRYCKYCGINIEKEATSRGTICEKCILMLKDKRRMKQNEDSLRRRREKGINPRVKKEIVV